MEVEAEPRHGRVYAAQDLMAVPQQIASTCNIIIVVTNCMRLCGLAGQVK
jgi:hypothetical protein